MSDLIIVALIGGVFLLLNGVILAILNRKLSYVKTVVDGPLTAALIRLAEKTQNPADIEVAQRAKDAADAADKKD